MSTTADIVRRIRGLRVVIIGDAMLDSYIQGTTTRLCQEGPVPVVSKTGEKRFPGGAANTAVNLRALGADVVFPGFIGADPAGACLRTSLREHGVDDSWLLQDPDVETLHKLRINAGDQFMVRLDEGEQRPPSAAMHDRLRHRLTEVLPDADVVVISDYGYGAVSDSLIAQMHDLCHGQPLVVDAKDVRRFRHAGATLLTPNHLEARQAVEPDIRRNTAMQVPDIEATGQRLFAMVDAAHLAVTMGEHGALLFNRNEPPRHLAAPTVAHADPVGAGDTFTAAAALALGAGADSTTAVQIGIEAAGISVGKQGTAGVTHDELLDRLDHHDMAPRPDSTGLATRLQAERAGDRRVVFTSGVFDLLHASHARFLQAARDQGDILVVGVDSDASVRRRTGRQQAVTNEQHRLALIAALGAVDHALLVQDATLPALIRTLRPDIHIRSGEDDGIDRPAADALREVGAVSLLVPRTGNSSTTGVIDRAPAAAPDGTTTDNGFGAQL